jgi:hypothetical protein
VLSLSPTYIAVCMVRTWTFADESLALPFWFRKAGIAIAARIPRINITTRSSIRVNPDSLPALSRSLFSI